MSSTGRNIVYIICDQLRPDYLHKLPFPSPVSLHKSCVEHPSYPLNQNVFIATSTIEE